jgi:hypothetical protein
MDALRRKAIGISQSPRLKIFRYRDFYIEEKIMFDIKLLLKEVIETVPIFRFKDRTVLMLLKDFQKTFDFHSIAVSMQIYTLNHQCLTIFHKYLIDIEGFNNFLF